MSNHKKSPAFATFTAVYTSGYFVDDPALVTALSLLFEKVYIPNHARFLTSLAPESKAKELSPFLDLLDPNESDSTVPPPTSFTLSVFTDEGIPASGETAATWLRTPARLYLWRAARFYTEYAPLFGPIFQSHLFRQMPLEHRHTPVLSVNNGSRDMDRIAELIAEGAVPVVGEECVELDLADAGLQSSRVAALLALNSVRLVLPHTRKAPAEDILETRERLKDHLPPFWASMLRASTEFQGLIRQGASPETLERECAEYVNTHVRPNLIDLSTKLERERHSWFYRIINPVSDGLSLALSRSSLSIPDLILIGIQTMASTARSVVQGGVSQDPALAYLIKLDKTLAQT